MADSVWFHGSACPPGNHGIMPLGNCTPAIHDAVSDDLRGGQRSSHAGFLRYSTTLLPSTGLSNASGTRVSGPCGR